MTKKRPTSRPANHPPPKAPKPEITAFVQRADAVAHIEGISRITMSRRLFGKGGGRALDNLAKGGGVNVVSWMDAQLRLSRMESELDAEPQAVTA
jgi:hypothetical protein